MDLKDLDAILDQALDDFEEQNLAERLAKETTDGKEDEKRHHAEMLEREKLDNQQKMEGLLSSLQDPAYGEVLQNTLRSLSTTQEGVQNVDHLFDEIAKQFQTNLKPNLYPDGPEDQAGIALGDREVAATMAMIGQAQQGMEGFEPAKLEEVGETMMEDMMAQFEALGEKEDYNEVLFRIVILYYGYTAYLGGRWCNAPITFERSYV